MAAKKGMKMPPGFMSEEHRRRISEAKKGTPSTSPTKFVKGFIPWNKSLKGIHLSPHSEFRKGLTPWNIGIKRGLLSDEWRARISAGCKNRIVSEETKRKLS